LGTFSDDERAAFRFDMGPMTFDFSGFVVLRLNEHALHTWDIDVALDPGAVIASDATAVVIDNLGLIARYTAKPTGNERTIVVLTSDPTRTFVIVLSADAVTITEGGTDAHGDLTLPAEAFIRLVYGRLDPEHTPSAIKGADLLDELRTVFPGP
jgi:hypothetical protein